MADRGKKEERKDMNLECFFLFYLDVLTAFIPEFRGNSPRTHRNLETSLKLPKKKVWWSGHNAKLRGIPYRFLTPQWEESRAFLSYLARCPLGAGRENFLKRGAGRLEKLHKSIMTTTAIHNNGEQDSTPVRGESQLSEQIKHWKEKHDWKKTHNEEGKRQTWASIDVAECYASSKIKNNWHKMESELRTRPWRESELRSQPFWAKKST